MVYYSGHGYHQRCGRGGRHPENGCSCAASDRRLGILYIDFSQAARHSGGSSLAQILNALGNETPTVRNDEYFGKAFNAIQQLIREELILAGHDISEGGLITALLEMCFPYRVWA